LDLEKISYSVNGRVPQHIGKILAFGGHLLLLSKTVSQYSASNDLVTSSCRVYGYLDFETRNYFFFFFKLHWGLNKGACKEHVVGIIIGWHILSF